MSAYPHNAPLALESHASSFGANVYDFSPQAKYYHTPNKRSLKQDYKDLRITKIDPTRGKLFN
jgi:hypothetical protein